MSIDKFSKEMLKLLGERLFRTQLNEKNFVQVVKWLETWIQDMEEVKSEILDSDEPIQVFLSCERNEGK